MHTAPRVDIHPFFLAHARGKLFCIHHKPAEGHIQGSLLYIPPFGEEMHKSRRMAALQARAFADRGFAVLQIDLTGCGDSSGDVGDATWPDWLDDIAQAYAWLGQNQPGQISLWGLRTGALLAAEAAQSLPGIARALLWQPVLNGDLYLNQLLRIRVAGDALSHRATENGTQALRAALQRGDSVEIAGNRLNPQLAIPLAERQLKTLPPPCPTIWIELGTDTSPASDAVLEAWRASGVAVSPYTVVGDPFWITQEICECPALIDATLKAVQA